MPKFYTFPHYGINVKDESLTTPLVVEQLALHRPAFISFAERGPIGVPVYGSYDEHVGRFGKGTFDIFSSYYRHPNLFAEKSLQNNRVFFVRVASENAKIATLILECSVYQKALIQYQKDHTTGQRILDTNGDPIPIDDGTGNPLKENGAVVKWSVRALGDDENPKALVSKTTSVPNPAGGANIEVTTYPVAAFIADSPGGWGNNTGFKLYWNADSDTGVAAAMKALIFTLGIVDIPWGEDTAESVRTKYLDTTTEFTFAANTVDKTTERRYDVREVLVNDYSSDNIEFSLYTYPDNVAAIGEFCLQYELTTTFPELTSPFMVNLFTGKSMAQVPYDHVMIDTDSTGALLMNKNIITYMVGGNDGDIKDADLESLTRQWLGGNVFPDLMDSARYPITHLYDSGYEMDTKEAIVDFLGIRDDVKIVVSTQSVYNEPNTKAEDQSAGSFLRSRALLHPESFVYGTQACRVTILQQCGKINDGSGYTKIVPATIDCMIKKGIWQGATYMKGKPKGLPNSAVTVLKDVNWFPVTADFKQLSWDNSLNYMQYYDMTSYHYPDVISVYPYLTSLLSDDIFTDMLIYIKHIVRFQWAKFAGVDDKIDQLISDIRSSVGRDIYAKLGNFVRAEVNPYQTDLDLELGYSLTVEIPVYGTVPNRVWNVIVPVRRETAS